MSTASEKKFTGKGKGLTWEEFEQKVLSWLRKEMGDKFGRRLWEDTLLDLLPIDLDDELGKFTFDEHCASVYDSMAKSNPRWADGLFGSERFWTKKWQLEHRQDLREGLFVYLETILSGEPERQLRKEGVLKMQTMRQHLFQRFGGGQPELLRERERKYLVGMPQQ